MLSGGSQPEVAASSGRNSSRPRRASSKPAIVIDSSSEMDEEASSTSEVMQKSPKSKSSPKSRNPKTSKSAEKALLPKSRAGVAAGSSQVSSTKTAARRKRLIEDSMTESDWNDSSDELTSVSPPPRKKEKGNVNPPSSPKNTSKASSGQSGQKQNRKEAKGAKAIAKPGIQGKATSKSKGKNNELEREREMGKNTRAGGGGSGGTVGSAAERKQQQEENRQCHEQRCAAALSNGVLDGQPVETVDTGMPWNSPWLQKVAEASITKARAERKNRYLFLLPGCVFYHKRSEKSEKSEKSDIEVLHPDQSIGRLQKMASGNPVLQLQFATGHLLLHGTKVECQTNLFTLKPGVKKTVLLEDVLPAVYVFGEGRFFPNGNSSGFPATAEISEDYSTMVRRVYGAATSNDPASLTTPSQLKLNFPEAGAAEESSRRSVRRRASVAADAYLEDMSSASDVSST
mgnify:FL=1